MDGEAKHGQSAGNSQEVAAAVMENLLQKNPVAKQFQDYVKKLKDIDAIANPVKP
jgi:ABC-type sugar transport system substrate-binding protein